MPESSESPGLLPQSTLASYPSFEAISWFEVGATKVYLRWRRTVLPGTISYKNTLPFYQEFAHIGLFEKCHGIGAWRGAEGPIVLKNVFA
jgi:hypothetical protein